MSHVDISYGESIADLYDRMYPAQQSYAPMIDVLLGLSEGRSALELGVGTGRIALELAARGVDVHGVDISPAMLRRLQEKPGADKLQTTRADMSQLALGRCFGVIYAVFNTFFSVLTQDAQIRTLECVRDHLEPDGAFVLEAFVPDPGRFVR